MNKYLLLLFSLLVINGCGDSNNVDDELLTCLGFGAPEVFVTVKDSQTEVLISTATVDVHYIESANTDTAIFDNSELSYKTILNQFNGGIVGLVVSEPNYHTFVSRDIGYELDTSCGANNQLDIAVHLCPLATTCI